MPRYPYDRAEEAWAIIGELRYAMGSNDPIAACSCINRLADVQADIATTLAMIAVEHHSQRRVADALGVPVSMLRGLKKEAARGRA